MKKKLKKNRLKIFIALSLMITCVFGVMFATNTFAYEDEFNNTYYDFNQLYNAVDENLNTTISGITFTNNNDGSFTLNGTATDTIVKDISAFNRTAVGNSIVLYGFVNLTESINGLTLRNQYSYASTSTIRLETISNSQIAFAIRIANGTTLNNVKIIVECINLTKMFGNGYEPTTINETLSYFNLLGINLNEYQRYTTSKKLFISNNSNTEYQQLTNDLEELDDNYNDLQNDYETLEDNYDTLNNDYTELENNYNQLESDYNDLQVDYDNLDNQLDEITSLDTNGMWAYFSAITISALDDNNNNVFLYTYNTFEDFKQSNFISGINIDLSSLKTDYPNYTKFNIFLLTPNSGSQLLLNNLYFRFLYNNTTNVAIGISNTMSFQIQLTNTLLQENEYKVNYDVITNNVGYFNENENITVLAINFEFDDNDNFVIQSTNNEYTNGFINGYTKGYNSRQNTINALQTDISNLNNQINTLQQEISILNGQVETLSNDEYSLNNLMWTIGATPFESFKHIWNVNFLGVNISEFILGIITTFIGLYILKKFFF